MGGRNFFTKGHENFLGDGCVDYLDCGDVFMGIYIFQNL